MFLATISLFTMYVCRVTLVTPDLQFMFMIPLTLGCLEKRSSDNGHGTRRWTTPGSLVFGFFRGRGLPEEELGGQGRSCRGQEVESWQEHFRTIISSGVCAKSTDIHIYSQMEYEHNFLEHFIRFYCITLYFYCLNIYLLYKLFVILCL